MGNNNGADRPPGVVQRCLLVKRCNQRRILRLKVIEHALKATFNTVTQEEQHNHHNGQQEHHEALETISENVSVRSAHHDIDQQYSGSDYQCPPRRKP